MKEGVGIITNTLKDKDFNFTKEVVSFLVENNRIPYVSDVIYNSINNISYLEILNAKTIDNCEFIIVIGGDGTILKTITYFSKSSCPILGINFGKVGFLATTSPVSWKENLTKALNKEYSIDSRMMIDIFEGDKYLGWALNDAVVMEKDNSKSINLGEIKVYVNKKFLAHYRATGIIVSSPTGATAYSLSAGGPIVNPNCDLMIINPLCAHSLNNTSIIVNPNEEIEIELLNKGMGVYLDGQIVKNKEMKILIKKSHKQVNFIRFDGYNFYELLADKIKEASYERGGLS